VPLPNRWNPAYIFQQRDKILPELKWQSRNAVHSMARWAARVGVPITENERRLAALRDKHHGQRAFVIGNGPSLRIADLDRLKDEITFACNKIYLAFDETDWRPTYYGADDALMFQHSFPTIREVRGPVKLFPSYALRYAERVDDAVYFRHAYHDFYPDLPRFSLDASRRVYGGNTVVYTLLQFALYMGIREIYLLGVDFSYTTPKQRVGGDEEQVFSLYRVGEEKNHFHKEYLRPGDLMYTPNT